MRGTREARPGAYSSGAGRPELTWPCRHNAGTGTFDETARRASHQELAVAKVLASEGHDVRTVAERWGARTPDLVACGASVEVKSFQALADRHGRAPGADGVANKLLGARAQGAIAVVLATGSGLSRAKAQAGYEMFRERAATEGFGKVRAVRIVGDGFDMSFRPLAELRLARRDRGAAPQPISPSPSPIAS